MKFPFLAFILLVTSNVWHEGSTAGVHSAGRIRRIVGGVATRPHEFPFLVSIRMKRPTENEYCGGSIISQYYVLTAAHCVYKISAADVVVLGGAYHLSEMARSEEPRLVSQVIVHPDYDHDTQENDIALLNMALPFVFDLDVQPISLATKFDSAILGLTASFVVSGWGVTHATSSSRSDIPRKVKVPIVPNEICQASYFPEEIFSTNLCAGFLRGGADACRGDSGGPLFMENPFLQIGIVSWGNSCALADYPGVYTKVSSFIPWIVSNTQLEVQVK